MSRPRAYFTLLLAVISGLAGGCGPQKASPEVFKDLSYDSSGHERQKLDLHLPLNHKGAPVVLWVHGGGWVTGNKDNPPIGFLKQRGYVVASMNYRYSTQAPFPAQIEDAKSAVRWLRAHADQYGYDGQRIAVWGHSAGGTIVEMLGVSAAHHNFDRGDNLTTSSEVQAVVGISGPTNFLPLIRHAVANGEARNPKAIIQVVGRLLGCPVEESERYAAAASPTSYVSASSAPTLLIHGSKDEVVPITQSQELHDLLKAAGAKCELLILPEADHVGVFDRSTLNQAADFTDFALGVHR